MASAPISLAVVQAAWAVAAVMFMRLRHRSPSSLASSVWDSVFRAMASMVCTASTGYRPAAVSPESMMALVPS